MKEIVKEKVYFNLPVASLRILGGWCADCAAIVLPIFEKYEPLDSRPREAISGIRAFAAGGKRNAGLRRLALGALVAARDTKHPAAGAAAKAAGMASSSAYTHPLVDVNQTKHILGPAACAAIAVELELGNETAGFESVRMVIANVPAEVREVLGHMPPRATGKSRLDRLMYQLDEGIRGVTQK
jgi:hypothetical protein